MSKQNKSVFISANCLRWEGGGQICHSNNCVLFAFASNRGRRNTKTPDCVLKAFASKCIRFPPWPYVYVVQLRGGKTTTGTLLWLLFDTFHHFGHNLLSAPSGTCDLYLTPMEPMQNTSATYGKRARLTPSHCQEFSSSDRHPNKHFQSL